MCMFYRISLKDVLTAMRMVWSASVYHNKYIERLPVKPLSLQGEYTAYRLLTSPESFLERNVNHFLSIEEATAKFGHVEKRRETLANDGSCCITCHFFVTCKSITYKECGQTFGFHLVDREVMDRVVVCFLPRMFVPVLLFSSSAKTSVSNFQFSLDRGLEIQLWFFVTILFV